MGQGARAQQTGGVGFTARSLDLSGAGWWPQSPLHSDLRLGVSGK